MTKEVELDKFVKVISNEKTKKDIKLKVEAKKLKNDYVVNVKSLIVTEALFDELGLKGDIVIERPVVKKAKKPSLRELIEGIATDVNTLKTDMIEVKKDVNTLKTDMIEVKKDVNTLKTDVNTLKTDVNTLKTDVQAIKNTPTMKRELNAQKRLKTLKQRQ